MTRTTNLLLGLFACGLLASAGYFVVKEITRVREGEKTTYRVEELAEEGLARVETPDEGWFPAPKQPLFGFEIDAEGWRLEDEVPLALSGIAPSYPPPADPGGQWAPDEKPDEQPDETEDEPTETEPPTMRRPESRDDDDFQDGSDESLGAALTVSEDHAHGEDSKRSLAVPVHFPDPATILHQAHSLAGVRYIAYDVFVPPEVKGYVGCLFFLKDKDGLWYQARSRARLVPGRWNTVTADIRGGSADVEPLGHLGQWEENQASQVRTIGLTFYGDRSFDGHVYLDNFRGWLRPKRYAKKVDRILNFVMPEGEGDGHLKEEAARLEKLRALAEKAKQYHIDPPMLLNLRTMPLAPAWKEGDSAPLPEVKVFDAFTVAFEINRQVYNPFDLSQADVRATVRTPSGRTFETFGYWYQDFVRRDRFDAEDLEPVGRPEWRVRVAAREEGEHQVTVRVSLNGGEETVESPTVAFNAVPGEVRGFLRVSRKDPRWFEFDNGEFFYPIGHNIHSPVDLRCWDTIFKEPSPLFRGLYMYESFFPKMAANGQNVGEVWMSSWWLGIEWTRKWRDYHGVGRYSLENAWKLDRLLEMARAHGLMIHLTLDNHGKFSEWCDPEWDQNPYNRDADGNGPVLKPSQFFTNERARELHKQKLRYIAARWGADPTIMGWELVSEFDLVGDKTRGNNRAFYKTEPARLWVKEMIGALRSYDPYDHLVTNHYASDYNIVDRTLSDTPLFDYIVGDAYRAKPGFASMAMATHRAFNEANKPFWITEFGGNWNATSIPRLDSDLHAGIWSSWMTHAGGTPLFWWYDFIDQRDLYRNYKGFAAYIRGEDRRGLHGEPGWARISRGQGLNGLVYKWRGGAYMWIYDDKAMEEMPEPDRQPTHKDVRTILVDLAPGRYMVEFWDTREGKRLEVKYHDVPDARTLEMDWPVFRTDIAAKVKWLGGDGDGPLPEYGPGEKRNVTPPPIRPDDAHTPGGFVMPTQQPPAGAPEAKKIESVKPPTPPR